MARRYSAKRVNRALEEILAEMRAVQEALIARLQATGDAPERRHSR